VLDAFHVTRLGFAAVDDVRRRVQQETLGHRGRRDDPLYRIRRVLRRSAEHLTETAWERLLAGLDAGDSDEQIGRTWIAAQDLRLIYQRAHDRDSAQRRLHAWLVHCADSGVPELHRLAKTIDAWREEFLAYFTTGGVSNGPTEGMNLLIKKIKRVGHGFRNFDNYRLRLLLHCGVNWQTPNRHHSETGYHAWLRRAPFRRHTVTSRRASSISWPNSLDSSCRRGRAAGTTSLLRARAGTTSRCGVRARSAFPCG